MALDSGCEIRPWVEPSKWPSPLLVGSPNLGTGILLAGIGVPPLTGIFFVQKKRNNLINGMFSLTFERITFKRRPFR